MRVLFDYFATRYQQAVYCLEAPLSCTITNTTFRAGDVFLPHFFYNKTAPVATPKKALSYSHAHHTLWQSLWTGSTYQ